MPTDIAARVQQLLKERQHHAEKLATIDQMLQQMRSALAGVVPANGAPKEQGQPPTRRGKPPLSDAGKAGETTAVRQARGGRGHDGTTLADHLEMVIRESGKPVGIGDLITGVTAAGYKSRSKNLRLLINLAVIKDKRFKRAGRGVYTLS